VLAHHIVQSFSPDDNLTPEEVNEIGRKTALEFTGGDYQFVVATHMDKG
ncbi:relaxase/mobilization nuclease domain-containing protein, partial [Streptococcus canis]